MKHTLRITLLLVGMFLVSQLIGLGVLSQYVEKPSLETGNVTFSALPYIERPVMAETESFWYIIGAILIGTALVLVLIRFRRIFLWKLWFFLSAFFCLTAALAALLPREIAALIGAALAWLKLYRPQAWTHNLSELLIYPGLAAIFVPVLSVRVMFLLLLVISVYDMYAVWKSKHMVKIAEFSKETNVFAGLHVSYKMSSPDKKQTKKIPMDTPGSRHSSRHETKSALLGGGDIGFPLLFAGAVFASLAVKYGLLGGFLRTLPIPIFAGLALFLLLVYGKKDRYYPALPFLTAGCLAGWAVVYLLS
ncbi:MAG: presenilin family intramembrane aspartyl protease [Nanoarchaeota archaeon]|nr:presenilin family intramembrane aspartyl protease [Nanoarchaeota archaeon]